MPHNWRIIISKIVIRYSYTHNQQHYIQIYSYIILLIYCFNIVQLMVWPICDIFVVTDRIIDRSVIDISPVALTLLICSSLLILKPNLITSYILDLHLMLMESSLFHFLSKIIRLGVWQKSTLFPFD